MSASTYSRLWIVLMLYSFAFFLPEWLAKPWSQIASLKHTCSVGLSRKHHDQLRNPVSRFWSVKPLIPIQDLLAVLFLAVGRSSESQKIAVKIFGGLQSKHAFYAMLQCWYTVGSFYLNPSLAGQWKDPESGSIFCVFAFEIFLNEPDSGSFLRRRENR